MILNRRVAFAALLAASPLAIGAALAGDTDPLFTNVMTDDPHRAKMALMFSKNQMERKHPVSIFLNDKAVLMASKANAEKFKEHQGVLAALVAGGAAVVVCPMCMKQFGVAEADLLPGLKVSNPELIGSLLFRDNTKTMSW